MTQIRPMTLTRGKRTVFSLLALTLSTLITLGLLESGMSWYEQTFLPDTHIKVTPHSSRSSPTGLAGGKDQTQRQQFQDYYFESTPVYVETPHGIRLQPNLDVEITRPGTNDVIAVRTNALGFRSGPIGPKQPNEYRVLLLGDSITCAIFTPEELTFASLLEDKCHVRVINAGVTGLGLREELWVLQESGLSTEPDMVLVGLFLDDAGSARRYKIPTGFLAHSALARRLQAAIESRRYDESNRRRYVRLTGKPFPTGSYPPNAWRSDRAAFDAVVAGVCTGWGYAWFSECWEEMRPDLEVLRGLSRQHGFELVVFLFPVTIQVEADFLDDRPQRFFEEMMSELGIRHLDLLPIFRKAFRSNGEAVSYDHCHLTPTGHRVVADALMPLFSPK